MYNQGTTHQQVLNKEKIVAGSAPRGKDGSEKVRKVSTY
jgi:hypothetical protein